MLPLPTNPAIDWFESKMIQLGLSYRTRRCLIAFWFITIEQVRDFINENWMEALRLAKAGFGRIVCEDLAKIPYLIQTHEEAKRLIPLVESLQFEVEKYDLIHNNAMLVPGYPAEVERVKSTPEYQKLIERSGTV